MGAKLKLIVLGLGKHNIPVSYVEGKSEKNSLFLLTTSICLQ